MSSRFTPPYCGASAITAAITRCGSVLPVSFPSWRQCASGTGQASTSPKDLNSTAFPSITGMEAAAPRSPRPRIAVPSETTATRFGFAVQSYTADGFSAMAFTVCATPGVYARQRSSFVFSSFGRRTPTLPPLW